MSDHLHSAPVRAELLHGTFPSVAQAQHAEPAWSDRHERVWKALRAKNPRLHDGPIWTVADATAATITVAKARYKHLAVQHDPAIGDLGVRQLGVKGLTVAIDRAGEPRILIARRGWRVRTYANMWETAPAGGVDTGAPLTEQSVAESLAREAREELGIDPAASLPSIRSVALIHDPAARSVELVAILPWPAQFDDGWSLAPGREEAWEYTQARWLPRSEVNAFLQATSSAELTPPARWILKNAVQLMAM